MAAGEAYCSSFVIKAGAAVEAMQLTPEQQQAVANRKLAVVGKNPRTVAPTQRGWDYQAASAGAQDGSKVQLHRGVGAEERKRITA